MNFDGRRTNRLPLQIPVEISYADPQGQPRLERTNTLDIDRQGARIATRAQHPVGSTVMLGVPHLGRSARCRVIWCSASIGGGFEIGAEIDSSTNLWGIQFAPNAQAAAPPQGPTYRAGLPAPPPAPTGHSYAEAFTMLVQILQEKGVIFAGELDSRLQRDKSGAGGPVSQERHSENREFVVT